MEIETQMFNGKYLQVNVKKYDNTNYEYVKPKDAVVVLAKLKTNFFDDIVFIKQYRPVVDDYLIELPAGLIESGESVLDCAKRELEEETGYIAGKLEEIGWFYHSEGYSTGKTYIVEATDLQKSIQKLDNDEKIEVLLIDERQAIYNSDIKDSKSIIAICKCLIL